MAQTHAEQQSLEQEVGSSEEEVCLAQGSGTPQALPRTGPVSHQRQYKSNRLSKTHVTRLERLTSACSPAVHKRVESKSTRHISPDRNPAHWLAVLARAMPANSWCGKFSILLFKCSFVGKRILSALGILPSPRPDAITNNLSVPQQFPGSSQVV